MSATKNELINDFTKGNITKQLLKFSTPLFLANMLQVVYNMVDMMVVGQVEGNVGVSAVSIGGDIVSFLTVLVMGFSSAAQVIISQFVGAGQRNRIGKFIGTLTTFLVIACAVLTAVGLILRRQMLSWMNTPAEAFEQAVQYSAVSMSALIFVFGYNAVSAILRGLGDSKHPFVFISIAAVLNIILDVVFVYGLRTGAMGAAIATAISQAVSVTCAVIFLFRNKDRLGFEIKTSDLRIDKEMLSILAKLGVPMALKSAAVNISKLFTNSFVNDFGLEVSAVTGVGNRFNIIGNLFSNSINTAGASMIGQNIGAKEYKRVSKILLNVWTLSFAILAVISLILVLFPTQAFSLFSSEIANSTVAMEYVPVAVMIFMASASRAGANALINGSGNNKVNLVVALLDAIILRIGLALLLGIGFNMGYRGFWYGSALAAFTPFFIGLGFYFSGRWKKSSITELHEDEKTKAQA